MFWIFKILPDLLWPALILFGILGFGLSYLPQAKAFHLPIKILAATLVVAGIFVCGMLYSDRSWQAAAQAAAQSAVIGTMGYVPGFAQYQQANIPDTLSNYVTRTYYKPVVDNKHCESAHRAEIRRSQLHHSYKR